MKLQINARSKKISRNRRKQIFAVVLATSVFACQGTDVLAAEDATLPTFSVPSTPSEKSSVLKSVGIKFVAPATQHSPQAPSIAVPVQINRLEKPLTHSVAIPSVPTLANNDRSVAPGTDMNSSKSADVLTMPPMLAGMLPNSAAKAQKEVGTVKIQIDPNSEAKKVIRLAPLVAAEKPAAPTQTAEAAKPMAVSVPLPPTLAVPTPTAKQIEALESSQVALAVESNTVETNTVETNIVETNLAEPPSLEKTFDLVAKVDTPKATATASHAKTEEVSTSVESRAPNIVRIPSMTLVQKSVTSIPSEHPPLKVVQEKPTLAQLTRAQPTRAQPTLAHPTLASKPLPEQEKPFVLPVHTDSVVKHRVTKAEPVLHDLPKIQESAIAHSEVVKDDQPALVLDEVEQGNAAKLANARQMSISAPRTATKAPTAFVAIPVSSIKVTSQNASANAKASNYKISDQNSDNASTDESGGVIEILHRNVRCVKVAGDVEKIEVEDESVCKGIVSDSKGLMLLGVGRGATRVTVWTVSESSVNQPPHILEITVREAWSNSTNQNGMTIGEATQSIAELFPNSRIAIKSHESGSLTVFGTTESGEQAKQVVSLVRKMFLVPVQDRIAVTSPN